MTHSQLLALSPILMVSATSVIVMLAIAIKRNHAFVASVSMVGLALALASTAAVWHASAAPRAITALLIIDRFACFYMAMILIAAIAAAALSHTYLGRLSGSARRDVSAAALVHPRRDGHGRRADHFTSFFVGLELLSMPMYGMAAYLVKERRSLEAGMKYLVLSAVASAFILFGMALIYSQTGTMSFGDIGAKTRGAHRRRAHR